MKTVLKCRFCGDHEFFGQDGRLRCCNCGQYQTKDLPPLPDDNPKTLLGMAKRSYDAVPKSALDALADAMDYGAKKYGRFNWREKRVTSSVYYNAILRHLCDWYDGAQGPDLDSNLSHLAHVMACCAILIDAQQCLRLNDDRFEYAKLRLPDMGGDANG